MLAKPLRTASETHAKALRKRLRILAITLRITANYSESQRVGSPKGVGKKARQGFPCELRIRRLSMGGGDLKSAARDAAAAKKIKKVKKGTEN